jgi:hypothetical protein
MDELQDSVHFVRPYDPNIHTANTFSIHFTKSIVEEIIAALICNSLVHQLSLHDNTLPVSEAPFSNASQQKPRLGHRLHVHLVQPMRVKAIKQRLCRR